jgi:hypothetical protein
MSSGKFRLDDLSRCFSLLIKEENSRKKIFQKGGEDLKGKLIFRMVCGVFTVGILGLSAQQGTAQTAKPSHVNLIKQYDGPQTCRACHEDSFKEVAVSLHYQQAAEPNFLVGWEKGMLAGMTLSF